MGVKLGNGKWAIKEDKLLAYNDNSGRFFNKEFDFSRGSSATYVAKDGLIKVSGVTDTELVTNGDFATDSDWQKSSTATISNGSAHIVSDGSYQYVRQSSVLTVGKKYRVEYEIVENNSGNLKMSSSFGSNFSPISSTVGFHSFEAAALITTFYIERQTACDIKIDNVSVVEIQTDVPRIDFTDTSKGALLLEPQSTNLITYSEDFSQWTFKTGISISSNEITSPDGTLNGSKIETTANGARYVGNNHTLSTGNNTFSVFAKKGVNNWIYLNVLKDASNNWNYTFDLENGVFGQSNSSAYTVTPKIEDYGNGWYRCSITANVTSSGVFATRIYPADSATDVSTTIGDNIYIYGAQVEEKSFATSYIPNHGVSGGVTRLADVCNNSGSAQDFNSEEGVLYAEIAALANDGTNRLLSINDSTSSNSIWLYFNTANNVTYSVRIGGVVQASATHTINIKTYNKIAIKYKENDFAVWFNGIQQLTDTSGNTYTSGTLNNISFDAGDGALNFYGKVRELQVFTEALTDEQLQKLTS
jgi:hypothetical protein